MAVTVLLVDDDLALLDCIAQGLLMQGMRVLKAENGQNALALAKKEKPDIIFLDVVLPDISGAEIAVSLGSDPATMAIPVIFLTGLMNQNEKRSVIEGRVFIGKPYSIADIIKEINLQLG